jgi:hypothetical protein
MAIFMIIRQPGENSEKLGGAVAEKFPNSFYDLGNGAWLISGPQTAKEASDMLGITPENLSGVAIVVEVASYFGRANPAIWSWIKNNWSSKPNG